MFAVCGRVSAGTPAKPHGADSGTISASFDVLAGDRRTSTVNRVSRGGVRDADAKVGSAARIFAVFGGVSGGTPVKPRCANSRTISASFDVPAGHRRTSTANLVCRGGVCDADAKVGTAVGLLRKKGGPPLFVPRNCTSFFRIHGLPPHTKMPIRLPTLAIRWSQARRTCAALPMSTKFGAKDHFRRRSRVRAYSRQKNEASKGLAASAFKCWDVQVPPFFRATSFGKSLRHLPKARRPANRDERVVAVPPFPRQQAKRLATSTLP
ncbi:hypothetical protein MRX96_058788 [Rhipicephalus microplus]